MLCIRKIQNLKNLDSAFKSLWKRRQTSLLDSAWWTTSLQTYFQAIPWPLAEIEGLRKTIIALEWNTIATWALCRSKKEHNFSYWMAISKCKNEWKMYCEYCLWKCLSRIHLIGQLLDQSNLAWFYAPRFPLLTGENCGSLSCV
jgi:hypothetical protein